MTLRDWVSNRLGEVSTYVGGFIVWSSGMQLDALSPSPVWQAAAHTYQQWGPIVGAALAASSTHHP